MKLYDHPTAPNPRRVHVFMAEKGIEIERINIDMQKGEHKTEAFMQKNANGQIPVLELDDGAHISESISICRYLEALQPSPTMFGDTAEDMVSICIMDGAAVTFGEVGGIIDGEESEFT